MRRAVCLIVLSVALMPLAGAARTVADFFASEPGKIFTLLTRTHRLDMVDYFLNGQSVAVQNNMQGPTHLVEMDSAYLKLQESGSKVVEMRLLTAGRDTVIAVIETVMTPVADSRLTLWNTNWEPAKKAGKLFKRMPVIDDFMTRKMPVDLRRDLQNVMAFPLIQLTFTGDRHDAVLATHGLQQFLVASEYERFAAYFKPSLTYRISGIRIVPAK